jgi:hypothetical protein
MEHNETVGLSSQNVNLNTTNGKTQNSRGGLQATSHQTQSCWRRIVLLGESEQDNKTVSNQAKSQLQKQRGERQVAHALATRSTHSQTVLKLQQTLARQWSFNREALCETKTLSREPTNSESR